MMVIPMNTGIIWRTRRPMYASNSPLCFSRNLVLRSGRMPGWASCRFRDDLL